MRVCVVGARGVEFDGAGETGEVPDGEADFGGEMGEEGEGWGGVGGAGCLWRTCCVRHGEVVRRVLGPLHGDLGES